MSTFDRLCASNRFSEQPYDDLLNPTADNVQDAWVKTLAHRKKVEGELPAASTVDELQNDYESVGGLLVTNVKRATIDNARKRQGGKESIRRRIVSLDKAKEVNATWLETVEDEAAQRSFSQIEAKDALARFYANAPKSVRAAIDRFIEAWQLQEEGERIPRYLSMALSRDREETGLALELRRGRP